MLKMALKNGYTINSCVVGDKDVFGVFNSRSLRFENT